MLTKLEESVIEMAFETIDKDRDQDLKAAIESFDMSEEKLKQMFCNSIGQHEAMDRTFLLNENVNTYLVNHPLIIMNEQYYRLASLANYFLAELYQQIGRE